MASPAPAVVGRRRMDVSARLATAGWSPASPGRSEVPDNGCCQLSVPIMAEGGSQPPLKGTIEADPDGRTARLDKLQQRGIIRGFDPDLDLRAMGYEVLAFVSLEVAQGRLQDVANHLREIPEVLEIHWVTGPGDLHCRVAARTNDHLQHIIGRILEVQGIDRTTTQIALTEQLRHRVLPLVDLVIDHGEEATA